MTDKKWVYSGNGLAKRPGWFSWRHKDRVAHDEARETWIVAHPNSVAAKKRRAHAV